MTTNEAKELLRGNADKAADTLKNIRDAVGSAAEQLHCWLEKMDQVQATALAFAGVSIVVSIRMNAMDEQPVQFLWGHPESIKNNIYEVIASTQKAEVHDLDEDYGEKRA